MKKKVFIGVAWPYANGSLHLGHVAGLIGGDILARYFRLKGGDVLMVSGSDCHGTPISVEADKLKIKPSEIAEKYHKEFTDSLINGLSFSYDCYTKTTTENHAKTVQDLFLNLLEKEYIYKKIANLPFCKHCDRFLPDRYIEGECPKCHFLNARGDQCDECGELMDAEKLLNPKCKICGNTPEWKDTEHFFLKLSFFEEKLKTWVEDSVGWRANAYKFTLNFLKDGLHDRAITRDTDWGIDIPLEGYDDKKIYVWFEAVSGYLSASKEWSEKKGDQELWKSFWQDEDAIHYYVHGKDNIPFHTIIWPAILMGFGGLNLPSRIISSEYLTLEKKQFSKSRNWCVLLKDFLEKFDAETLRYYLVMSGPETSDADFSWKEYQVKTNNELIAGFGNLINRVFSFIQKNYPEGVKLPDKLDNEAQKFLDLVKQSFSLVGGAIEKGKFREGLKSISNIIEEGNRFINNVAPWQTIKNDKEKAAGDLAIMANAIYALSILINPYLPNSAEMIKKMIITDHDVYDWNFSEIKAIKVANVMPLYKKIEDDEIKEQIDRLGK